MTLTPDQLAALAEIQETWPDRSIVVIGATALGFYIDMRWRRTADIDLVVAVDVAELSAIAERPGWSRHPDRPHEFRSPRGARLDILPAAASLIDQGSIRWPGGSRMSLIGMDLAFSHCRAHDVGELRVQVAPPAVVTVLKMAAYLDRPAERERDLADIGHLLDVHVDDDSDLRWEEAADVDFELQPAFLLGRDIAAMAGRPHRDLVDRFLATVGDPGSHGHAVMQRGGPAAWRRQDDSLEKRLHALRRGYASAKD